MHINKGFVSFYGDTGDIWEIPFSFCSAAFYLCDLVSLKVYTCVSKHSFLFFNSSSCYLPPPPLHFYKKSKCKSSQLYICDNDFFLSFNSLPSRFAIYLFIYFVNKKKNITVSVCLFFIEFCEYSYLLHILLTKNTIL